MTFRHPKGSRQSQGIFLRTTYFCVSGNWDYQWWLLYGPILLVSWKEPFWSTLPQNPRCGLSLSTGAFSSNCTQRNAAPIVKLLFRKCVPNFQHQQYIRVACLHTHALATVSIFQRWQSHRQHKKLMVVYTHISWVENIISYWPLFLPLWVVCYLWLFCLFF